MGLRKIKYISIIVFLLGNVIYQGKYGFADNEFEQSTTTTATKHSTIVESSSTQMSEIASSIAKNQVSTSEARETTTGSYNNILYTLKGTELQLTGVSSNESVQEILIDSAFVKGISPRVDKLVLTSAFFDSLKGKAIDSFIISSSLNLIPCISDGEGRNIELKKAFAGNESLVTVDFGLTDFSSVTDTSEMFANCSNLKMVQINKLYATNLAGMFKNCVSLEQVNISENVHPVNLADMFNNCPKLVNVVGINQWRTETINNVSGMFLNCGVLMNLDLSQWPITLKKQLNDQIKESGSNKEMSEENAETNLPIQGDYATTPSTSTASEWQYQLSPQSDRYILTKYIGKSTTIIVPNTINGKPTSLQDISKSVFPNYQSITSFKIASGNKVPIQDADLRYAFQFWPALKEVDLTGLDTSAVTNIGAMFANVPLLTKVDLSGWDTSNITDMNYMFNADRQLQELVLANWDVRKVTNMTYMFAYLSNLKTLDLSSFQTNQVTNMNSMFIETTNLRLLNLSQFNLTNVRNMGSMFTTSAKSPLLVIAKDSKLLNYNYSSGNRTFTGPTFNAGGGTFADNSTTKNYFQSIAITPTDPKLQIQTFNQFKSSLAVEKPNSIFAGWQVNGVDNASNVTDLLTTTYQATWTSLPEIPSDTDNVRPGTTSLFGLTYIPKQFGFLATPLNESGTQQISFNKQNSFDVGVCDKSQTDSTWSLQAQLVWDRNQVIPGSAIILTNQGSVQKNINDGTTPFNPNTDLVGSGNEVQGAITPAITSNSPVMIMQANPVNHNAVYNYNLGNPYLNIAETKNVQPGIYKGNIEWNLVKAP